MPVPEPYIMISNFISIIFVIFLLICLLIFSSCMTVQHKEVPVEIKEQFEWETLELAIRERLQDKYGGLTAFGTGNVDKNSDGSYHIDTTAKLEVFGSVLNETMGHVSGAAKTAIGAAK